MDDPMGIRSLLYRAARLIGDANAIRRGGKAPWKRLERRALGRLASKAISKIVGR